MDENKAKEMMSKPLEIAETEVDGFDGFDETFEDTSDQIPIFIQTKKPTETTTEAQQPVTESAITHEEEEQSETITQVEEEPEEDFNEEIEGTELQSKDAESYIITGNNTTKVNHATEFTINLKQKFEDFQVNILDGQNNNILFNEISEDEESKVYQFVPVSKGKYKIKLSMNGQVTKHPVQVTSEVNYETSTVAIAKRTITKQENIFKLFLKNDEGEKVVDPDVVVKCEGPNEEIKVNVKIDFHNQITELYFTPTVEGKKIKLKLFHKGSYTMTVTVDGIELKGSPYSFTTISQKEAKDIAAQRYSVYVTKHASKKLSQRDVFKLNNVEDFANDDDFFDSFEEEEKNQIVSENIELELRNQALLQENADLKKQLDFVQNHSGQEDLIKIAERIEMEKLSLEESLNKSLHMISDLEHENKELRRLIESKDNRIFQLLKENSLGISSSQTSYIPKSDSNDRKSILDYQEDDKAFVTTIGTLKETMKKNTDIINNAKKYPIILNANIISYQNGKPVYYNIQVQTVLETYEVQKRYNEFLTMHQELSKLKGYVFPHFPEKLIIGNQSSQNIKKRFDQLQAYLQFIVEKSELLSHEAVQSFLAAPVDEHLI